MPDGQVVFEITGDGKKVKASIEDVIKEFEKAGVKLDRESKQATDNIGNSFTSMFKKISAAAIAAKVGKTLLDWGKAAIQAASDLEEVQNVVDVTFGDSAGKIEKWAKAAGQQFGLTETQAKKFTSTLGAMMKSAGLAGPEIVDMSTDLAGLAADMASFYNLDFETAFQKIRSGISGETEPLKQLGINMSVANLEAFALTKGITKAFNAMSQGEQTMLRYQYLMQATSDAQGDFARTSDGYANAVRTLETNIEQLKTSIGNVIIPIVGDVVAGINSMIGALTQTAPRTVLDDFADIDLKTGEKLAQIQQTADEARAMIAVLEEIGGKQITSTSLTDFIGTLSGGITGLDSALSKAKKGDYAGTITALADALSKQLGGSPDEWETLLSAIGDALPDAVDATLDDKGQTAAFLEAAAAAADDLGDKYPALWKSMLGVLGDNAGAAITALANGATSAAVLGEMAKGFNSLSPLTSANKWESLLKALNENGNFDFTGKGTSVKELAEALNSNVPDVAKNAWSTLISVLSTDPESLKMLTGSEDIAGWLETMAGAADDLSPTDALAWDSLFGTLKDGLPNLPNVDQYKTLAEALASAGSTTFGNITGGITGLAEALEGNDPNTTKAQAWKTLLNALASDMSGLSSLTQTDADATAAWLETMAAGVNALEPDDANGWAALFEKFKEGLPALTNKEDWISVLQELQKTGNFQFGNIGSSLVNFAKALTNNDPNTDRAAAWRELLDALASDTETLQALTGQDAEGAAAWLEKMSTAANNLNPASAEGWDALLGKLLEGLPGLKESPEYSGLFEGLYGETNNAEGYLRALGYETDDIADKQAVWLNICRDLVKVIPGLSEVINTETGEVKGGVDVLRQYVEEWQQAQTDLAMLQSIQKKRQALSEQAGNLDDLRTEALYLRALADLRKKDADAMAEQRRAQNSNWNPRQDDEFMEVAAAAEKASVAAEKAEENYTAALAAVEESYKILDRIEAEYKDGTAAAEDYEEALTALELAASGDAQAFDDLTAALTTATSALDEVSQYYDKVKQESESSIKSVVKGFEAIETPAQKAWRAARDLTEEFGDLTDAQLDLRLQSDGTIPSIQNMADALDSQLQYLQDYQKYIDEARARGVSEDILAALADGSTESFDYLKALATGTGDIEKLNAKWAEVEEKRESLTESLTSTKLNADDEFQSLVDAATEAAAALDVYDEAKTAMESTVQGIADGIRDKIKDVGFQVDALNTVLGGIDPGLASWLGPRFAWSAGGGDEGVDGSFATGLDYVPFDNFLAQLHEGESILTAEEARVWRNFKYGGHSSTNTIDYEALGGTMRDNIKPGGNVYLDGRIVGSVISAQQGNSLRALERSGWQQ